VARFRFKIVDSSGRRRSGILRAESLEEAESAFRSKLCEIELLTPLSDDGRAVELSGLESSFARGDRIRRGIAAVLGCVCLLSVWVWIRTPAKAVALPEEPLQKVSLVVTGSLQTDGLRHLLDGDLSDLKVHAVFPELPYEIEGKLAEDGASFSLPLDFQARQTPKELLIEVTVNDERWRVPEKFSVSSQGETDVGLVKPLPPEREPREVASQPLVRATATPPPGRKSRLERKREERKLIQDRRRHGRGKRPDA
jgi:hypothetical protein